MGNPSNLVHGLFTSPSAQISRIRELNSERGWGITDDALAVAECSVPERPKW